MTKKCTNTRRNLLQFEFPACKGVGVIIEEIIDSRYIGIYNLSVNYLYRKKKIWELSKNYRYRKFAADFIR